MTELDNSEASPNMETSETSAQEMRLAAKLDHLFRKAGEGEETRLVYQAILNFRLSELAS